MAIKYILLMLILLLQLAVLQKFSQCGVRYIIFSRLRVVNLALLLMFSWFAVFTVDWGFLLACRF